MSGGPSALILEGEAGIGKTTVWFAAIDRARQRGFTVLSARAAEAESVLAYAGLADVLGNVDAAAWAALPAPQTRALERVLSHSHDVSHETDQRAVAAGFCSLIDSLAGHAPVLLAIDDLQWLDPSSVHAVAFAARRLTARVGVLATERIDPASGSACSWLQLPRPEALERVKVGPLSLGGLSAVVSDRLGRSVSRPTMVRIAEISGGNPFYALELARAMEVEPAGAATGLPNTLADLVRARVGGLDSDVHEALLAAACMKEPTIDLIAGATDADTEETARLLEDAEDQGLVVIDGHQIRFAHPLLARGVYTGAGRSRRRTLHRRLAGLVEEPELQARHLALASVSADPKTLESLDQAAKIARARGAPAAAAELLDLALGLGGDTPERRIRSAHNHRDAGDLRRSQELLQATVEELDAGRVRAEALSQLAAVRAVDADYQQAVSLLERALNEAENDDALRAQVLVSLSFALLHAGRLTAAVRTVDDAVAAAERAGQPHLLCQALSLRVNVRFLRGDGVDQQCLQRALELEDEHAPVPMTFRPSVHRAMYSSWTGDLQRARDETAAIRQRCIDRGEENDLIHVTFHSFQIELWLGRLDRAEVIADEATQRARQLGGDLAQATALTMRALLFAHVGREDETRADAHAALEASLRCGAQILAVWPITALGLLELSLGNYDSAVTTLSPLIEVLEKTPDAVEICTAPFVADAAEALIQVGRLGQAEALVERLERCGHRLDRARMLAVGGRCRSMLLAAGGHVDAASEAARLALAHHDRLPMPFERARTQLLWGRLQRRQRHRDAAAANIRDALSVFDDLGCALWSVRARAELDRATAVRTEDAAQLTKSERRVAELVASGMSNREVAAALFISPKTVEVNLSRVYRKLGIRSRAGLARRMDAPDGAEQEDPGR
ncbi:transcriptional regulator [Mycolicibacterium duvalii]|uniref:Transcriptional regulator n=2 Tax=Mycolicibacterium duvalii TaxID=39688 RepID=A0A7I7K7Y5_9MYCO|nr:LuxR family transcriptional regulator [Mycolicibacterium duvalii]BBX19611.1 transcriptional regulator [Mycolicibacterium duvalii]